MSSRVWRGGTAALAVVTLLILAGFSYHHHSAVRHQAVQALASAASSNAGSPLGGATGLPSSMPSLPPGGGGGPSLPIGPVTVISHPGGTASSPVTTVPSGHAPSSSGGGPAAGVPAGQSEVSVAVLTPLLSVSKFGASFGFLLVCNTGVGALSAAAGQVPGLTKVINPVITQISPLCTKLSAQSVDELNELNSQLKVLDGLNQGTAPFFAEMNNVFAVLDQLAPELQPLSGTLTSIGPLVDFFAGPPS